MSQKIKFIEIEEKKHYLNIINNILYKSYLKEKNIGLLSGLSGLSIFFFYYEKFTDFKSDSIIGLKLLKKSIRKINNGDIVTTYSTGIAGLAWTIEFLSEKKLLDADTDELLADIEPFLYENMISDIRIGNFDFLHGAIGYGIYFLKRYKNTQSKLLKKKYKSYIKELIYQLECNSETQKNIYRWKRYKDILKKNHQYDLSLSHGIASIVNFLSRLYSFHEFRDQASHLLKGSISFLLNCQNNPSDISFFPSIYMPDKTNKSSRLAWCYGDLGIAISMMQASKVLNDTELYNKSVKILLQTTKRKIKADTEVKDAMVCHGSFGLAQVYMRACFETGNQEFKKVSEFWIQDGMKMIMNENAGINTWESNNKNEQNKLGILQGLAGIGLTLISSINKELSDWDEALLLS